MSQFFNISLNFLTLKKRNFPDKTKKNRETSMPHGFTIYGGRYKTRTCDLPHVKRMRYQLRQSSSSLQARGILHDTAPNVKNFFLNPPFFFTATQKSSFRHKKKQSLFITGSVFLELNAALRLAVDRQHFFNAKGLYRQLAAATFSQTRNDTLLRILARRQLDH